MEAVMARNRKRPARCVQMLAVSLCTMRMERHAPAYEKLARYPGRTVVR